MCVTIPALLPLILAMQAGASPDPLGMVQAIELPHVEGRIDHLALDADGQRLFVAALGNNTVQVIDVPAGRHRARLPGFREPRGIAAVADTKAIAVANGQGDGIQIISADDCHLLRAVSLGDDADNVRYDPAAQRLYVGYGGGAIAAVTPGDGNRRR